MRSAAPHHTPPSLRPQPQAAPASVTRSMCMRQFCANGVFDAAMFSPAQSAQNTLTSGACTRSIADVCANANFHRMVSIDLGNALPRWRNGMVYVADKMELNKTPAQQQLVCGIRVYSPLSPYSADPCDFILFQKHQEMVHRKNIHIKWEDKRKNKRLHCRVRDIVLFYGLK